MVEAKLLCRGERSLSIASLSFSTLTWATISRNELLLTNWYSSLVWAWITTWFSGNSSSYELFNVRVGRGSRICVAITLGALPWWSAGRETKRTQQSVYSTLFYKTKMTAILKSEEKQDNQERFRVMHGTFSKTVFFINTPKMGWYHQTAYHVKDFIVY